MLTQMGMVRDLLNLGPSDQLSDEQKAQLAVLTEKTDEIDKYACVGERGEKFYDFTGATPERIAALTGVNVARALAMPPHDLPAGRDLTAAIKANEIQRERGRHCWASPPRARLLLSWPSSRRPLTSLSSLFSQASMTKAAPARRSAGLTRSG